MVDVVAPRAVTTMMMTIATIETMTKTKTKEVRTVLVEALAAEVQNTVTAVEEAPTTMMTKIITTTMTLMRTMMITVREVDTALAVLKTMMTTNNIVHDVHAALRAVEVPEDEAAEEATPRIAVLRPWIQKNNVA